MLEKLFEGNAPTVLNPKTVVSVTGLAYLGYQWLSDRGVVGIVRVSKADTGQVEVDTHMDFDEGFYDGVMAHAEMVKGDRRAAEAKKRYHNIYAVPTKETGNGHGH